MDAVGALLDRIGETLPQDPAALRRLKIAVAVQTRRPLIRNDALVARYRDEVAHGARRPDPRVERILMLNGIRSSSGVATVTVLTKPYACPGRCVYCPTEARAPKSYLPNEPAVLRALRNDYDPYRQVRSRLAALEETGHPTDKIELIIKGGTWSFYPVSYQQGFIRRCCEAANDVAAPDAWPPHQRSDAVTDRFETAGPGDAAGTLAALESAQQHNETAGRRLIGITIETRPDYITVEELCRLRTLGVTRVELGVQSLQPEVLKLTVRDHGLEEIQQATRLLKDAGFKVAYHLMPNLPGATPESDLDSARRLFADAAYQPDALKLYPCVVVDSAELFTWWREGRYVPYDDETLLELLIRIKRLVPPYVRIERVIRDIPSTSIQAGCAVTNLREDIQRRMRERGLRCRCIRCRQVRDDGSGTFELVRRQYAASGGTEVFLSFEDPRTDRLAALLRLRIPSDTSDELTEALPPLRQAALIRELHTYGPHLALRARHADAAQHRGFGRRLLAEAERIAREEFGRRRIVVIAGVGVREYYRRFGYALEATYMVKHVGA
jgi:elongator complex protein 3